MADTTALKNRIRAAIKANDNQEITGPVLQQSLLDIVDELNGATETEASARQSGDNTLQQNLNAETQQRQSADTELGGRITTLQGVVNGIKSNVENGYVYAGIATPSSTPTTGKVFYLALTAGTYTNFGNIAVTQGINILKYNGSAWSLDAFIGIDDTPTPSSNNLVKSGGVFNDIMTNGSAFDLTAYNNGTTYANLNAALTALNALPAAYKKGGMSFKYVQTSDNKYVQYRYMGTATTGSPNPFLDTANWQGVDDMLIAGSQNLVKSGGAYFTFFNYIVNSLGNKGQISIAVTYPVTAFPVKKGKKYYIYVKASEAGEENSVGIYEQNPANTLYLHLTKAQFEGGFVFEYSTNQDNVNIAFRTRANSTVEYTVLEDYRIIDVLDEINNQILDSGSIVAASTSVLDWSYNLKANETVVLYAQCNNALNANAGWYINSSKIHTFENIQNGDYFVYTPSTDVTLNVRTGVSGVTLNWGVLSYKIAQIIKKLENLIKQIDDNIQVQILDKGTIISDSTVLLDWSCDLKANHRYTLYAQSNGTLESANRGFYNRTTSNKVIDLPADISNGYYAEYIPSEDITICLRTGTIGDVVNYAVYSDDLHEVINSLYDKTVKVDEFEDRKLENYWYGKIIAGYGDSITNHAGPEWSAPWTHFPKTGDYQYSWAYYVGMAYQLAKYYGRGIGGQCFAWNGRAGLNGGSVTFINAKGESEGRNDSYDYDNYTGSIPSGCVKSRGALCSWKRITDMFPASIKDTIHAVLVMGGTNDIEWSTDFEFVANDTTDPEWAASSYYNTIGGDYNINSLAGGFASTIMKLQLWMPNAVIIVMTPSPNNAGGSPRFEENLALISTAYNKSLKIKSVADIMSLALIDINAHSGINSLTGYTYIGDGVHPTNRGKMMIARVIIGELKNIIPMTIEET